MRQTVLKASLGQSLYYNSSLCFMRNKLFIFGLCMSALLASCSKSLTDIGYKGGPTTTTLPPEGRAFSLQPEGELYDKPTPQPHYVPSNFGGAAFPYNQTNISTKSMAESLKMFYKGLLSAKFDAARFAKKNKNFLADNIKEEIQRYSDSVSPKAPLYGWQIFMGKGFGTETSYSVSHYGGNWYQIGVEDCRLEDNVFVRIDFFGAGHIPKITGISNDYLDVHINDK